MTELEPATDYARGDVVGYIPALKPGQEMINRLNEWQGLEAIHFNDVQHYICTGNSVRMRPGLYWEWKEVLVNKSLLGMRQIKLPAKGDKLSKFFTLIWRGLNDSQ